MRYPVKTPFGVSMLPIVHLKKPERLEESATKITEGIKSTNIIEVNTNKFDFSPEDLSTFMSKALNGYDKKYGGKTGAPKFPFPNAYEFMMKQHWLTGDPSTMQVVKTSLDNMANGGIYDHLGGGFARYSTDETWLVPHFEKMLYDNGQLVSLYSKAYAATKNPLYKETVENQVFAYPSIYTINLCAQCRLSISIKI